MFLAFIPISETVHLPTMVDIPNSTIDYVFHKAFWSAILIITLYNVLVYGRECTLMRERKKHGDGQHQTFNIKVDNVPKK